MPKRVLVPLAPGFEEIEAITVIDILRRAGVDVIMAGILPGPVEASRKTRHLPDCTLDDVDADSLDMIVLHGGYLTAKIFLYPSNHGFFSRKCSKTTGSC